MAQVLEKKTRHSTRQHWVVGAETRHQPMGALVQAKIGWFGLSGGCGSGLDIPNIGYEVLLITCVFMIKFQGWLAIFLWGFCSGFCNVVAFKNLLNSVFSSCSCRPFWIYTTVSFFNKLFPISVCVLKILCILKKKKKVVHAIY